ncbi:hypothetical protein [Youxingia wuxianensis]|uniref:Uncharacterized protein n=1 Tax=Youxingia wuxianensis TaxID=2763678 RepID=A0A926EQE0_9FIRM|nr:hypothetical protein [Youxingia wuxianensis]MBC8584454.1 hypothetical protein [Youxingia wuxianensis]
MSKMIGREGIFMGKEERSDPSVKVVRSRPADLAERKKNRSMIAGVIDAWAKPRQMGAKAVFSEEK